MGMIRKMTSLSTLGLVDFRSDKERTARYTRQTRNATRAQVAQNMQALELQREQLAQAHVHHVEAQAQRIAPLNAQAYLAPPPPMPPAGWYPDQDAGVQRWWDGSRWTEHTQPLQPGGRPPALSNQLSDNRAVQPYRPADGHGRW